MAKHEFGIMESVPQKGKRYDEYEPQKYDCISVCDEHLEEVDIDFNNIDFYWHTLDAPGKGLAYCGVTLVPPESIEKCVSVVGEKRELLELKELFEKALVENKWIIHFGL